MVDPILKKPNPHRLGCKFANVEGFKIADKQNPLYTSRVQSNERKLQHWQTRGLAQKMA